MSELSIIGVFALGLIALVGLLILITDGADRRNEYLDISDQWSDDYE